MGKMPPSDLVERARRRLEELWAGVDAEAASSVAESRLPSDVIDAMRRSINSATKTYRYVLPTQLLAKLIDPAVDCRVLQAESGLPGAFDARSLCHDVIVPFDRANHNVLGGSTEPYVNNPVRIPAIVKQHRRAQKNKAGFDDLQTVLDYTQTHPRLIAKLVVSVLQLIKERLGQVVITYPTPNRISAKKLIQLLQDFLEERTGGNRLQPVASALFECLGQRWGIYAVVNSASVNAADASTGSAADLECVDDHGQVVLAVEVKDRQLTLRHVQDKLPAMRAKGISELLFLVQGGVEDADVAAVDALTDQEFTSGQNVYVADFWEFLRAAVVLLGEQGRRELLEVIGKRLDAERVDFVHRQAWRNQLATT